MVSFGVRDTSLLAQRNAITKRLVVPVALDTIALNKFCSTSLSGI